MLTAPSRLSRRMSELASAWRSQISKKGTSIRIATGKCRRMKCWWPAMDSSAGPRSSPSWGQNHASATSRRLGTSALQRRAFLVRACRRSSIRWRGVMGRERGSMFMGRVRLGSNASGRVCPLVIRHKKSPRVSAGFLSGSREAYLFFSMKALTFSSCSLVRGWRSLAFFGGMARSSSGLEMPSSEVL